MKTLLCRTGLTLVSLVLLVNASWCCSATQTLDWETLRPACKPLPASTPSTTATHVCLNTNMDNAVALTQSERFKATFDAVITKANSYLSTLDANPNYVIITDLDETLVDNSPFLGQYKSYENGDWPQWQQQVDPTAYIHANVMTLLKTAKERGFSVMFITGRNTQYGPVTLNKLNTFPWDGTFFRPQGITIPVATYKAQIRRLLESYGYRIVMNLGDQPSDFDSPIRADEGDFLLPNILYTSR